MIEITTAHDAEAKAQQELASAKAAFEKVKNADAQSRANIETAKKALDEAKQKLAKKRKRSRIREANLRKGTG
ncbi:MAG: hypothetical protein Q4A71_01140 [Actinomycetaceae bacterium]|nr:hypothetical protein [Actinomycetaceae bacterium]